MTQSMGTSAIPVTTGFTVPGMTIERDLGVTFGLVVRSMGAVKSISAGFKALRQGEVSEYTQLLEDSRWDAIDPHDRERAAARRQRRGRDAFRLLRKIGQQLTEIVAYGTAVVATPSA